MLVAIIMPIIVDDVAIVFDATIAPAMLFLFLTFDFMLILVTCFFQMVVQLCLKLWLVCVASTVPRWL